MILKNPVLLHPIPNAEKLILYGGLPLGSIPLLTIAGDSLHGTKVFEVNLLNALKSANFLACATFEIYQNCALVLKGTKFIPI